MKRFRMQKQKIVKPDGRWMYMYTFEEQKAPDATDDKTQESSAPSAPEPPRSEEK